MCGSSEDDRGEPLLDALDPPLYSCVNLWVTAHVTFGPLSSSSLWQLYFFFGVLSTLWANEFTFRLLLWVSLLLVCLRCLISKRDCGLLCVFYRSSSMLLASRPLCPGNRSIASPLSTTTCEDVRSVSCVHPCVVTSLWIDRADFQHLLSFSNCSECNIFTFATLCTIFWSAGSPHTFLSKKI